VSTFSLSLSPHSFVFWLEIISFRSHEHVLARRNIENRIPMHPCLKTCFLSALSGHCRASENWLTSRKRRKGMRVYDALLLSESRESQTSCCRDIWKSLKLRTVICKGVHVVYPIMIAYLYVTSPYNVSKAIVVKNTTNHVKIVEKYQRQH